MTPAHIRALREQLGETQQGLADRLNAINPLLRVNRQTVYRWTGGSPARSPNPHSLDALTRLWLDAGYPVTADGQPATLTTASSASSYGLPQDREVGLEQSLPADVPRGAPASPHADAAITRRPASAWQPHLRR